MTLDLTPEEKDNLVLTDNDEYAFAIKQDAPKQIKESLQKKIEAHKKWLKEGK